MEGVGAVPLVPDGDRYNPRCIDGWRDTGTGTGSRAGNVGGLGPTVVEEC